MEDILQRWNATTKEWEVLDGGITFAKNSTNKLELHFSEGGAANKIEIKYDGTTPAIYMDGAKQFTLREMITEIKKLVDHASGGSGA